MKKQTHRCAASRRQPHVDVDDRYSYFNRSGKTFYRKRWVLVASPGEYEVPIRYCPYCGTLLPKIPHPLEEWKQRTDQKELDNPASLDVQPPRASIRRP